MNFFRRSTRCVFCELAGDREAPLIRETDTVFAVKDIRPATKNHFLVIPKRHVDNAKRLTSDDLPLFRDMLEVANELVQSEIGDERERADVTMGCTWPPFTTVAHLHLHVLSPASAMTGLSKLISMTPWFVDPDWIISRLKVENANS